MSMLSNILAIGWEPELRGIFIIIISVGTLCGSIYLILGTNLGVRLGFLALAVVNLLASFFIDGGLGLRDGGPLAIGFSLLAIGLAAMSLVLDFDFIENGAEMGAPKYMEWYAAFGLMVTLVWLYLEILRLLSKLRD